jgi:protein ImuB
MRLLHLAWPHLPLRLARATSSSFPSGPVILGGQPWDPGTVLDANLEARAFGVRRGLPLGEAHKLAPEATFVSVDPDVARAAFERALDALGTFSPAVEGEPDPTADGFGTAYLGIEGLDRLWGGERRLVERIAEALEPLLPGPPRAGIGGTRFGASVAALTARYELPGCRVAFAAIAEGPAAEATFLAPLPLDLLPADDETHSRFRLFGLRRMGELAALPRSAVLARFGEQGGFLHALARGDDPRPLSPRISPQRLIAEIELDPPVESREPLRFVLRRLLVGLCAQLAARGRAAGAVRLRLIPESITGSDGARARESIEMLLALPEPSAEPESIERLLVGRLESMPIDHPIGRLAVELERVSGSVGRQLPLFVPQAARVPGLEWQLARLALRFGPDRVRQARIEDPDARLPEDRFRWLEAATGLSQPS